MLRTALISVSLMLSVGCGMGASPSRGVTSSQALTGTAEWLEFEAPQVRVELFRDLARQSSLQAGSRGAVLFPNLRGLELEPLSGPGEGLGAGHAA